jgi:molybdopterin molybdotransferase
MSSTTPSIDPVLRGHPAPMPDATGALGVAQARELLRAAMPHPDPAAPGQVEQVTLAEARGRVLARDVQAPHDVPPHDNAAMDGYAFDGRVLAQAGVARLRLDVQGAVRAGAPWVQTVPPGHAVKIMTGAVMPPGCDTVVPIERCVAEGPQVVVDAAGLRPGDHRRLRGEDLVRGGPVLRAGRRLRAPDLGLMASLGLTDVAVHRRLRVALFSTGDELREPGQALSTGCIYDSNRRSLAAAVQALGAEPLDLGLVPDDPDALRAALAAARDRADVVLTSGGVSQGDADHTRTVLADLGTVRFWRVALRPGQPLAFGVLRGRGSEVPLLALPGNPVAALVSFLLLARDALLQRAGAVPEPVWRLRARSLQALPKRVGRTEVLRGLAEPGVDGALQVRTTGAQGSGILSSFTAANVLIVLDEARGPVSAGDEVEVWPLDGLI